MPHRRVHDPDFEVFFIPEKSERQAGIEGGDRLPQKTPSQIPLYHILWWIAIRFRRFVFFLFCEQKYFVNFVYFGDCNSQENVLYCNHNRGGTRQWQSKRSTLIGYDKQNTTGSEHRAENTYDIYRVRSEHESQCVVRQIKVLRPSPFTNPVQTHETTTSRLERLKKQDFTSSWGNE